MKRTFPRLKQKNIIKRFKKDAKLGKSVDILVGIVSV